MDRKSFLDQEAPPGYVAGLGRGASGFSTQADLGSNSRLPAGSFKNNDEVESEEYDEDERFLDADNDEDDNGPLIKGKSIEDDDEEADRIYEEIEKRIRLKKMNSRKRKILRNGEIDTINHDNDKVEAKDITIGESMQSISEQFKDYKENLSTVSIEEWSNLPESGDFTKRNKRTRLELQEQQRFYRNSDSVTSSLRDSNNTVNGLENNSNKEIDIVGISLAKDKILAGQLTASNTTTEGIDQFEYLKQLGLDDSSNEPYYGIDSKVVSNVGDYHKTRLLFSKMREANPYKPDNWIASARLEFEYKKFNKARGLIQEGCNKCPKNDSIWLVNIEMNSNDLHACKVIVAEGIKYNPKSLKLWLKATELENDLLSKRRILKKSLEYLPKSSELWLRTVNYEDDKELSIKMLNKATELIPESIELWLKLVELETVENARKVLNKARKSTSKDQLHIIWIAAAKLEEAHTDNEVKVNKLIEKCFKDCEMNLNRYQWLHEAVICENESYKLTSRAIVLQCMNIGMTEDENEKLDIWKSDAESAFENNNIEISRSIYLFITLNYPKDIDTWILYIKMEKSLKNYEQLFVVYELAITANPDYELFYLMYTKDKWLIDNNIEKSRDILKEGLKLNPFSESLWLALIKLEWKSGFRSKAEGLFEECRLKLTSGSSRLWYKSVTLERQLSNLKDALVLIEQGLELFPNEYKLYLQRGQIYESMSNWEKARESYDLGTKLCPSCPVLWTNLSRIDEFKQKNLIKARSTLDQGITMNPTSDLIYLERIQLEKRSGNSKQSKILLSKALKIIPESPILWAENILNVKASQKKNTYTMALTQTKDSPVVILSIAVDLWKNGKVGKAKQFFDACFSKDQGYGDYYLYYYSFLLKHGNEDEIKKLEEVFKEKDPNTGSRWCSIFKKIENLDRDIIELLREEGRQV